MSGQCITSWIPPEPPDKPEGNNAATTVDDSITTLTQYASDAISSARSYMQDIVLAANIPTTDFSDITVAPLGSDPVYNAPSSPDDPVLNPEFPAAPDEPILGTITPFTPGDVPEFTGVVPALNTGITVPDAFAGVAPSEPNLNEILIPEFTEPEFPAVPTMLSFSLPSLPTVSLPVFSASHGDVPLPPDAQFSFTEAEYTSTLLDAVKSKLETWVEGTATGLPTDVEAAIWERGRAREVQATGAALDQITQEAAARGFVVPTGVYYARVDRAIQDSTDKITSFNRDVAIKQAELEQTNIHFAIERAVQMEGMLIVYANNVAQRAFEAAKAMVDTLVALYNARVQAFIGEAQMFSAEATVFEATLRGELARLEQYKAELEGQRLIGDMNKVLVEVYKGQLEAVSVRVDIYKSEVEAAKVKAAIEESKVTMFRGLIEAFKAQVEAKTAEFDGYAKQIQAEVAKSEMYRSEAQAYEAVVNGYRAKVDALRVVTESEIKVTQELPLEVYKAEVGAFSARVDAEAKRLGAVAAVFDSRIKGFSSEVSGEAAKVDAGARIYAAKAQVAISQAGVEVDIAKANASVAQARATLAVEAAKGAAQVSGQIAAGALSAMNVSASIQSQDQFNDSYTVQSVSSNQQSNNTICDNKYIHNYNED